MAAASISRPSVGLPKRRDNFIQVAAKTLHSWQLGWRFRKANPDTGIKVVCIADTHNTQPQIPDGDILLHAGDLSQYGMFDEIQAQLNWLNSQPHKWKVVIAGNHDLLLDSEFVTAHPDRELEKPRKRCVDLHWGDVLYLCDESVELDTADRKVKIFGSPRTPRLGNFAFQYSSDDQVWQNLLPQDTDILLTHGPPAGLLDDGAKGCEQLRNEFWRVKPPIMVFGHIHAGHGQRLVPFDDIEACYENVTLGKGIWVNFSTMVWKITSSLVMRMFTTTQHPQCSQLANSAVVGGLHNGEKREPVVIFI